MSTVQPDHAADLREVYLYVFDAFAASVSEVADLHSAWNTRYARELLGTLQHAGHVILTEDGDGSEAYQASPTYDEISHEEAEKEIDAWLPSRPNATAPGSSGTRSSLRSPEAGAHPCGCGCGEILTTRAVYRPGHDARHAGAVGRAIAANYNTKGFDRRELLATLGSDKLREKAERIAANATDKATKRTPVNLEPTQIDGIVKVGKTERVGRKHSDTGEVQFLDDKGMWKPASKSATKTFQEG